MEIDEPDNLVKLLEEKEAEIKALKEKVELAKKRKREEEEKINLTKSKSFTKSKSNVSEELNLRTDTGIIISLPEGADVFLGRDNAKGDKRVSKIQVKIKRNGNTASLEVVGKNPLLCFYDINTTNARLKILDTGSLITATAGTRFCLLPDGSYSFTFENKTNSDQEKDISPTKKTKIRRKREI